MKTELKIAAAFTALIGWFPVLVGAAIYDHNSPQTCRNVTDLAISGHLAIYRECHGTLFTAWGEGRFIRWANDDELARYYGVE